jgi:hypothetical protein
MNDKPKQHRSVAGSDQSLRIHKASENKVILTIVNPGAADQTITFESDSPIRVSRHDPEPAEKPKNPT